MNALYALLAVLALVLAGLEGGRTGAGRDLLTLIVPYAAFAIFLAGFCARKGGAGHLVLEEGISTLFVNGPDSRGHHGIIGYGERQLVNDDATELLALHVNPLPER